MLRLLFTCLAVGCAMPAAAFGNFGTRPDYSISLLPDTIIDGITSNNFGLTQSGIALDNQLTAPVFVDFTLLDAPPTASYVSALADATVAIQPGQSLVSAFYPALGLTHPDYVYFLTYHQVFDGGVGAVPEPSAWLLAITGFAAVGLAVRYRRGRTVAV